MMVAINNMKIKEVIVVEGRDDTAAINRSVEAETIETHGFGMSEGMWTQISTAYQTSGIIVLTDPDYAGEQIRSKIKVRFPLCKEAFLPRNKALKGTNIGVENATPEDIREALSKAKCTEKANADTFTMEDMIKCGLTGSDGSRKKREQIADALGTGYGNVKKLLSKLNGFNITREEFYGVIQSIDNKSNKE